MLNKFSGSSYSAHGLSIEGFRILEIEKIGQGDIYPYNSNSLYYVKNNQYIDMSCSPSEGYKFIKWEGTNIDTTESSINIFMGLDKKISCIFKKIYDLNITIYGDGTHTPDDAESYVYVDGDQLILTASAPLGNIFDKWQVNDKTSREPILILNFFEDKNVKLFFQKKRYKYTKKMIGSGTLEGEPNKLFYGDSLDMTAVANDGFSFSRWDETFSSYSDSTVSNYSVYNDVVAFPVFEKNTYIVSIGVSGEGDVEPFIGNREYSYGDIITLSAVPGNGYLFRKWNGNIDSKVNSQTYVVKGDTSIIAEFVEE